MTNKNGKSAKKETKEHQVQRLARDETMELLTRGADYLLKPAAYAGNGGEVTELPRVVADILRGLGQHQLLEVDASDYIKTASKDSAQTVYRKTPAQRAEELDCELQPLNSSDLAARLLAQGRDDSGNKEGRIHRLIFESEPVEDDASAAEQIQFARLRQRSLALREESEAQLLRQWYNKAVADSERLPLDETVVQQAAVEQYSNRTAESDEKSDVLAGTKLDREILNVLKDYCGKAKLDRPNGKAALISALLFGRDPSLRDTEESSHDSTAIRRSVDPVRDRITVESIIGFMARLHLECRPGYSAAVRRDIRAGIALGRVFAELKPETRGESKPPELDAASGEDPRSLRWRRANYPKESNRVKDSESET